MVAVRLSRNRSENTMLNRASRMAAHLAAGGLISICQVDFEGRVMDSLAVSATSAAIAFGIIAWGFIQVYG